MIASHFAGEGIEVDPPFVTFFRMLQPRLPPAASEFFRAHARRILGAPRVKSSGEPVPGSACTSAGSAAGSSESMRSGTPPPDGSRGRRRCLWGASPRRARLPFKDIETGHAKCCRTRRHTLVSGMQLLPSGLCGLKLASTAGAFLPT